MRIAAFERLPQAARATAAALLAAALLDARGIGAQQTEGSGSYRLRWVREGGAESCASGAALSRLLEQVLGERAPATQPAMVLEGVATAAPPPLRFRVRVTVRDAATSEVVGERELTTADAQCSALTPALLLVLAMSVDPEAGRTGLPPSVTDELRRASDEDVDVWPLAPRADATSTATKPAALATLGPAAPKLDRPRPAQLPRESPARLSVFGALAAATAILPSLSPGVALGARLPLRRGWTLSLTAFAWNPQSVSLPETSFLEDGGIEVAAGQASFALCRPLLGERLQLGACGGLGAGLRWVKAPALAEEDNPTRGFFGPELGLEVTWRASADWFLAADIAGQGQLLRDRFTYRAHTGQTRPWFEPSWLASRLWLSIGVVL